MDADGVRAMSIPLLSPQPHQHARGSLLVESIDLRGLGATCTHELDASRTLEEVVADLIVTSDAL
jgi:hypothetical protein